MLSLPVETIIFDLDGTLRHSIPSAQDIQFRIANQLGVVDDPAMKKEGARWTHYYWAQSTELVEDMTRFADHDDKFWIQYGYRYLQSLGVSEKQSTELAPAVVAFMENDYHPDNHVYPCVPDTLGTLKGAGFTLGLVSNRSNPCQHECQELGILEFFDFTYVAAEVDAWKPDPRIFDRAIKLTATDPEKIIYIGDNYFADVIGAQNAGLQPVLLDEEGLFPDAGCSVIARLGELVDLLI